MATSATREAANARQFIDRARTEAGVDIEVISGVEEARLIHLGVLQAVPVFDRRLLLIDVGGGSTELLIGECGETIAARSLKVGAVRLTDRFFPGGKVTTDGGEGLPQPRPQPHRALPPRRHHSGVRGRRRLVRHRRDGGAHRSRGDWSRAAAHVQLLRGHAAKRSTMSLPGSSSIARQRRARRSPASTPIAPTSSSPEP